MWSTHGQMIRKYSHTQLHLIIILIIIKSFYSLWGIGHPWRASRHWDLQLFPWPHSMIFLFLLFHLLLSFATFSSAYLFFYIPEDSNLMLFSLLLLLLCVMCVQSNSIFFFYLIFCWLLFGDLHSLSFVILSVHFIFIFRLKHLFANICNLLVIWLVVFHVSQVYSDTDFIFVLNNYIWWYTINYAARYQTYL